MADTERTLSSLLSLLADNTAGDISAQDVRDMLVSLVAPRGSFYVADGDAAETAISSSGQWTKLAGTTTLGANEQTRDFDMPSDNRLRYTGAIDRDVLIIGSLTVEAAGNNVDLEFAVAKNDTVLPSTEQDQFFKTASEKENVSFASIVTLSQNDYLELFVENQSDTSNVTATRMQLVATGYLD